MSDAPPSLTAALADRYRVERELGQGGMATVFLAEDLRHHRKVAIKILRPELAAVIGGDRFLHEITVTANLQHPHILGLIDSGQVDGTVYYVMPYVEGESLRQRLTRERQLPVEEAVRLATQVAGALDYAHRHGVIHRDIKPENILLHDGQALVADFGIALAVSSAGGSRMTETGMSLGTPHYMSPEQAMGERVLDARSDVYALGCVLYEMMAGEPPFTGPTAQAILARVLTETPRPLRAQRHTIPEHVEAAVVRALEKLPADRWGSAAEFAEALGDGTTEGRKDGRFGTQRLSVVPSFRPSVLFIILGFVALTAAVLATWALLRTPPARPHPVVRFSLIPPPDLRILDVGGSPVAVSPDGSKLVYLGAGTGGHPRQLYLWTLDGGAPEALPGTENAGFHFFSPDGQGVGFLAGGQLRRVPIGGGGAATIGDAGQSPGSFRGATWTSKGEIIFATSTGLRRIPADGGASRPLELAGAKPGDVALFPEALPRGEAILVTALHSGGRVPELAVVSLADGQLTLLHQPGSNPRYVETGWLAFTSTEGALEAAPFDARRLRFTGPPKPIADALTLGTGGVGKFSVSRSGAVAYLEGWGMEQRQLVRVDRRGVTKPFDAPTRSYSGPRISPDGRRIAVTIGPQPNPPLDLWVYDLALGTLSRVTYDSTSSNAEWAADGKRLYHRRVAASYRAMATTPDGSAPPESLYATNTDLWEVVPTRSGDTLITRELRSVETDRDLMLVPLRPAGPAVPWAAGPRIQAEPALSPDGRWLAYSSEESGGFEVYVRAFPGPGPRYQVSAGGGLGPRWNPKGGEIFFLSRDSLIAVPVRSLGNALELGRGKALFANRYAPLNYHAPYDVSPDGTWFVFVGVAGAPVSSSFRIVLNWFDQPVKP